MINNENLRETIENLRDYFAFDMRDKPLYRLADQMIANLYAKEAVEEAIQQLKGPPKDNNLWQPAFPSIPRGVDIEVKTARGLIRTARVPKGYDYDRAGCISALRREKGHSVGDLKVKMWRHAR